MVSIYKTSFLFSNQSTWTHVLTNSLEWPTFPTSKQFETYLEAYANNFGLRQYIQFSTTVVSVERDTNDTAWRVNTTSLESGEEQTRYYDKVVVATGVYKTPNYPDTQNIEAFAGKVLHSQEIRDPSRFAGKSVLIVGSSATAADLLCFLGEVGARKLYLSHRSPFYIVSKFLVHLSDARFLLFPWFNHMLMGTMSRSHVQSKDFRLTVK
jgi:cation diffusion facilitator CzcD-associated flavoprotein CzcO